MLVIQYTRLNSKFPYENLRAIDAIFLNLSIGVSDGFVYRNIGEEKFRDTVL